MSSPIWNPHRDRTKNVYKRHSQSLFLSSLEMIFAATLQKETPVKTKSSPTGNFASRLVTAVLTATEDGQVDVSAYQISEQAVAMVEADMIEGECRARDYANQSGGQNPRLRAIRPRRSFLLQERVLVNVCAPSFDRIISSYSVFR